MTKQKAVPHPTRKHLARVKRERMLSRLLIAGVGMALAAATLVIAYGLVEQKWLLPHRPAATVNGEAIPRDELGARTALAQSDLLQQRRTAQQMQSLFGDNPDVQKSLQDQIDQIDAQLNNPNYMAAQTLQGLVQARLIRQEAQRRGITVSDEDVQRSIEQAFGYYAAGTPTPQPTATSNPALAVQQTADAARRPTATPATATPTTVGTETPTVAVTPAPSPTAGPTITPYPTATPMTLEGFQASWQQYLDTLNSSLGVSEKVVRDRFAETLYRDRLRQALAATVPHEEEQVWAKHILLPDEVSAQAALARLRNGEKWDALAASVSLDTSNKDNGGDLGWFGRGQMVAPFATAAFDGEVGKIVGPVQTSFGWHLILIVDHAVRQLDATTYQSAVDSVFSQWLSDALAQAKITYDPELVAPTTTPAPTGTPGSVTPESSATSESSATPERSATP
ncbi:MAG TPA: peptidylprolyl isomerase [Anaerolineales bacterium]|nr:peptidylprolyl isomerase [Anaerolineales bacterium]